MSEEIFIRLLNEDVDVWRPVQAERLREGVFRIIQQPYDHELEVWEFEPGAVVACTCSEAPDGVILVAVDEVVAE
jgi:hypothetical protein